MAITGRLAFMLMIASISIASSHRRRMLPASFRHEKQNVQWYEDVSDYPEEIAEKLLADLKRNNKAAYFLNGGQEPKLLARKTHNDENKNYTDLCPSERRSAFFRFVEIDGEEYYVLNPKSDLRQHFHVEICLSKENNQNNWMCNHIEHLEPHYQAKCVQEFMNRTVNVMPKDNPETLLTKDLPLPSCCSCKLVP